VLKLGGSCTQGISVRNWRWAALLADVLAVVMLEEEERRAFMPLAPR
jgi:hypothetical protein